MKPFYTRSQIPLAVLLGGEEERLQKRKTLLEEVPLLGQMSLKIFATQALCLLDIQEDENRYFRENL